MDGRTSAYALTLTPVRSHRASGFQLTQPIHDRIIKRRAAIFFALRDALGAQHAYAPDYRRQTVLTSPASPNSDLPITINDLSRQSVVK
jgi:hypothetical protein